VQQTTAEYLERELGWEPVYAYNQETFGPEGTLGRASDRETLRRVSERPAVYQPVTKRPNCHHPRA
jgi:hypothetical protein